MDWFTFIIHICNQNAKFFLTVSFANQLHEKKKISLEYLLIVFLCDIIRYFKQNVFLPFMFSFSNLAWCPELQNTLKQKSFTQCLTLVLTMVKAYDMHNIFIISALCAWICLYVVVKWNTSCNNHKVNVRSAFRYELSVINFSSNRFY